MTPELDESDFIPEFLTRRPDARTVDHVALARSTFSDQDRHATDALRLLDLRMEETEEQIGRLQRQMAEDRREAEALAEVQAAARRALARLDGVDR